MWALLVTLATFAAEPPAAGAEEFSPPAIVAAIERLGHARFLVREEAADFLWRAGAAARPALNEAVRSKDREVSVRAKVLLEKLDWEIGPNTPPDVVSLLRGYQAAGDADKRRILEDLGNKRSFDLLLRILRREPNEALRDGLVGNVLNDRSSLATLLAKGDRADADRWMQLAELSPQHHEKYALYVVLGGNLEGKVRELTAAKSDAERLLLARLLRLQGKYAQALAAVRQVPFEDTRTGLNFERRAQEVELLQAVGDWAAVAEIVDSASLKGVDCENNVELFGHSAYFHRRAGQRERVDERVADLKKLAAEENGQVWMCLEALLVNDRFDDAEAVAAGAGRALHFEVLVERGRYRMALDVVSWSGEKPAAEWLAEFLKQEAMSKAGVDAAKYLAVRVATLLARLGKNDEAKALYAELAARYADDLRFMEELVGAQRRGHFPAWIDHAAAAIDKADAVEKVQASFAKLGGDASGGWWTIFRDKFPADTTRATLERFDDLCTERWGKAPLTPSQRTLVEESIRWAELLPENARLSRWGSLGEFCQKRNERALARTCFERVVAVRPNDAMSLRLGDIAAADERWDDAAAIYRRQWEQTKDPLPLFLLGVTYEKLGRGDDAKWARELARLIPVANESRRTELAQGLEDREMFAAADAEWRLMLNSGSAWSYGQSRALQALGNRSAAEQPLFAADLWERLRATVLRTESSLLKLSEYFEVAHKVHGVRARGLIAERKFDEALEEALVCVDARPEGVDGAILLITAFEKAGAPDQAERLFARVEGHFAKLLAEYPASAKFHNGRAWLLVKTGRQLESALVHAERAVELMPNDAAPLDTLALVRHERGEHRAALEHARRCAALVPGSQHFQTQLAEFAALVD